MSKVIEPPILLSRALTFVLATSVVVLATLVFTLYKMAPLERPEVFFVLNETSAANLTIKPMNPEDTELQNIENYKRGFIREYIIARNTIRNGSESDITSDNWTSVVKPWSTPEVYDAFKKTKLYKKYRSFGKSCAVSFSNSAKEEPIIDMKNGFYRVNFTWLCKNSSGQLDTKSYKINLRIQSELEKGYSGLLGNFDKLLDNPLGIRVSEYKVMGTDSDPLDSE